MKNLLKIAILGCALAALLCSCPGDPGGNGPGNNPSGFPAAKGKMTINGLGSFNDKYVYVSGVAGSNLLLGLTDITGYPSDITYKLAKISGGKVEVPLYMANSSASSYSDSFIAYSGNDTISSVSIIIINDSSLKASNVASVSMISSKTIVSGTFSNGNMTIDWGGGGSSNESYSVTFNANGGSPAPQSQAVAQGGKVTQPSAITKNNAVFDAWYKDSAYMAKWNFDTDTVTSNITLYAKWNYTVTFNANGGSPAPQSQAVAQGGKVTQPTDPTKTGYTFDGWYKEETCINQWNFSSSVVTEGITLYAKWLTNYTVDFNTDGGTPVPAQQVIAEGRRVTERDCFKEGVSFAGWYKESSCINLWDFANDTVTGNITLFAKWGPPVIVSGTTLTEKLQWLSTNARSGVIYTLEVSADENLAPKTLSYNGKSNITIQLKGIGSARTITLSASYGSLFSVGTNVTLVLEENLILLGQNNNNTSLVKVNSGGKLIMNQGVKITGNAFYLPLLSSQSGGGGVYVAGTFTMNGGEISGNTVHSYISSYETYGGGVYVVSGTFTMNGGEISGNTAISNGTRSSYGGGVYADSGTTFTMNGGEISGNTASASTASSNSSILVYGGGVCVASGTTFTMTGGKISGNTAINDSTYAFSDVGGGGVYASIFTMTGGEISGNTAISNGTRSSYGGGVQIASGGKNIFTMSDGKISGNTASRGGGVGVTTNSGETFTMTGGEISGNTAFERGGGVLVYYFTKSGGGTITGYASDTVNGNVVKNSSGVVQSNQGHAVYVWTDSVKRRETTAGPGVDLDSSKTGTAGGWEN
jgi:uncharacterized repeat protein (TIGR02543 family)